MGNKAFILLFVLGAIFAVFAGLAFKSAIVGPPLGNNPPAPPSPPGLSIPKDFTLQNKIAQLLMVGVTEKSVAVDLERKYQVGGFLLKTHADLFSRAATAEVTAAGELPPLFAVDQEGGEVSRLPQTEFKKYTAKYLGTLPDDQVRSIAAQMGRGLADIGAQIDLAPVTDLDDGHNAAISTTGRSFSSDPDIVAQKASAFASGLHDAGVVPTFKHFPGLGYAAGATSGNTDTGSATTPPLSTLETSDLKPYASLLSADSESAVMVGNQIVPGLTQGLPASLSPAAYQLLRTKYGFSQVVFTDELLEAVAVKSATRSPEDAVIDALQAGADMPVINPASEQEVGDIIAAVEKAVQTDRISQSRINESLARVLLLKAALAR